MIEESKLTAILDKFTPGEKEELRRFLDWKVRPSERYVLDLLEKLCDKKFCREATKETLFHLLFPGKKFREQGLYTAFSDLLMYVKTFLALEHISQHPYQRDLLYLEELEQRETDTAFALEKNAWLRQWEKQPLRHSEKYVELFRLHDAADRSFMKKQKREYDDALQQKIDALDVFYFSTKLREACEVINRHNIIGETYSLRFIEEIVEFTDAQPSLSAYPAIAVYATTWKMITTQEESYFAQLKSLLQKNLQSFPQDESRNIVNYCMNYCIRKINTGNEHYLLEAFELYNFQLETQLIFNGRYMTQWDYKNIITVGIRLKKYEWTENFIHQYKERIEPAFRENAGHYNLANFYYEKGEYRKAIRILNEVDFSDVYYILSAKSLLLKIYYEQEEYDALINLADSFKTYLVRNQKVSPYQKTIHLNLVKYLRKATSLQVSGASAEKKAKEKATWKQKLTAQPEVANISWVKNVWDEL